MDRRTGSSTCQLLIVESERISRVQLNRVVLRADADVLVHHRLPLFDRATVPLARLDEWIDEQVVRLANS